MKNIYIIRQWDGWYRGNVAVFANYEKAKSALKLYADYFAWNYKTRIKHEEETRYIFENESVVDIEAMPTWVSVKNFQEKFIGALEVIEQYKNNNK